MKENVYQKIAIQLPVSSDFHQRSGRIATASAPQPGAGEGQRRVHKGAGLKQSVHLTEPGLVPCPQHTMSRAEPRTALTRSFPGPLPTGSAGGYCRPRRSHGQGTDTRTKRNAEQMKKHTHHHPLLSPNTHKRSPTKSVRKRRPLISPFPVRETGGHPPLRCAPAGPRRPPPPCTLR